MTGGDVAVPGQPAPPTPSTVHAAVVVVVPAFNEARTLAEVIRGLRGAGFGEILVVDDGSTDATGAIGRQEAVVVLRHLLNRGLGAALGTGVAGALARGAQIVVTFDADGQHCPGDVEAVIAPIVRGEADVVLGSRLMRPEGMPWYRKLANHIANAVTFVLFGMLVSDSQSGLRALGRRAAQSIEIRTDGMEVSSEIIGEVARRGLRLREVPIRSIYTAYSLSKGQSFTAGLRTLGRLLALRMGWRDR